MPSALDQALISALDQQHLILTPNSRLKRSLLKTWSLQNSGKPPYVMSLTEWLNHLWQQLQMQAQDGADKQILTPLQSRFIWQKVVQQQATDHDFISPQQLSLSAEGAYRTLQQWQLGLDELDSHNCDSSEILLPWIEAFNEALTRQQLITLEQATETIMSACKQQKISAYQKLYLYAFEQLPPLQQALIDTLSQQQQSIKASTAKDSQCEQLRLHNFDDEVRAAAHWARDKISRKRSSKVGIVALNLGQNRDKIERIFTEVFEPQALLGDSQNYTLPFNFSAGVPLASTPIVNDALLLLELQRDEWPVDDICQLLMSPFFSDAEHELPLRSDISDKLRRLSKTHISGADLRYCAERAEQKAQPDNSEDPLQLSARLQAYSTASKRAQRSCSASEWVTFFERQLQLLGWPGSRALNSHEHQQMAQWQQLLQDFRQLDACGYSLSYNSALSALRSHLQNHHFQAQTPDSPIQILGALEGAGLNFDACWVLGVNARSWPSAPSPNPLLPIDLQRTHNMPHASAERELSIAQALTLSYQGCAPEVIFSYASTEDGNATQPSSLISQLPERASTALDSTNLDAPGLPTYDLYEQSIISAGQLEKLIDDKGPNIEELELSLLRGGSSVFRDQASCPMIAFAKHRLGAKTSIGASRGLSAIDRGNIIHAVLEQVWNTLKTSSNLRAQSDENLNQLCQEAIAKALAPYRQKLMQQLPEAFFALEEERLLSLTKAWLEQDLHRAEFEVIACEAKTDIVFEGLALELRLDRLDQLQGGELLLIDYKTGKPSLNQWQGERPAEPQLPLYALTAAFEHGAIAAIAFARVDKSDSELLGLGNLAESLGGKIAGIAQAEDCAKLDLPEHWDDVINFWRSALTRLATEFKQGCAAIDYRDANAERYSEDYHPLTRIPEREQIAAFNPEAFAPAASAPTQQPPVQGELL